MRWAGWTSGVEPIELRPCGIGFSPEFTRALYLDFQPCPALTLLSRTLQKWGGEPYDLQPHLSLIYAHLTLEEKQSVASEVPIPPSVRFDAVLAMATNGRTVSKADVQGWEFIGGRPLHCAW